MERGKKKAELEVYRGGKNQIIVDPAERPPAQPSYDVKGLAQGWRLARGCTHTPSRSIPALAPTPQQRLCHPKTASAIDKQAFWTPTGQQPPPGIIWQSSIGVASQLIRHQMKAEGECDIISVKH